MGKQQGLVKRQKVRGKSMAQTLMMASAEGMGIEDRQVQSSLGLASLNNFSGLWAICVVSSYLLPGSGVI